MNIAAQGVKLLPGSHFEDIEKFLGHSTSDFSEEDSLMRTF